MDYVQLKELEKQIQSLLKNNNIQVCIKDNIFYICIYDEPIYQIHFDNFRLKGSGVEQKYYTVFPNKIVNNHLLLGHKEIIETCLLIDDDVENKLKSLVKEYIQY